MKYVVLVSHGTFAPGLHSVLKMLAGGEREDVISVGLEDGMSADEFAEKFSNAISKITEDDEIILLGDIVGGSPLTNAIEQVSNKGLIGQTVIFGGMNLAMALTATLMKDGECGFACTNRPDYPGRNGIDQRRLSVFQKFVR